MNRLMLGVKTAPAAWQRFMDQILQNVDGAVCFFDDIAIQGETPAALLQRLKQVMEKLRLHGLHLNGKKCEFFKTKVGYLGHYIDGSGLYAAPDKIAAISKCLAPTNVSEVRTFLGLVHYYQKFIPNMSNKLYPLYALLKKNTVFRWTKECEQAYTNLKEELTSTRVLVLFNPKLPLTLATDASPTGSSNISHYA